MSLQLPLAESDSAFLHEVERRSGQNLARCYQCGKCSAGCPIAFEMDYPPHQVIRGVQMGMRDLVLASRTIWLCAACETCSTRCPQDVDPAGVMDALRRIAYAEGVRSPEQDVPLFHRLFLGSVRQFGRVFEVGLIAFYNLFSGHLTKDLVIAPKMLLKGKLSVLPPSMRHAKGVKEMFARADALEVELE
ncbi:MAG: 4Fe-4S dicluster domain-containing protein [Anaerolineae bacterium]